jgi:hypothetical protein
MRCTHPECTEVHDNNRWAELCPRSRALKRTKDARYQSQFIVWLHRGSMQRRRRALADDDLADMYERGGMLAGMHDKAVASFHAREKKIRTAPVICNRTLTARALLAATHKPELRTWYH